jgi:hypothetical protein
MKEVNRLKVLQGYMDGTIDIEQMDVPGIREKVIREAAEIFKGNIFWGEDLMEIPVKDPEPMRHKG